MFYFLCWIQTHFSIQQFFCSILCSREFNTPHHGMKLGLLEIFHSSDPDPKQKMCRTTKTISLKWLKSHGDVQVVTLRTTHHMAAASPSRTMCPATKQKTAQEHLISRADQYRFTFHEWKWHFDFSLKHINYRQISVNQF